MDKARKAPTDDYVGGEEERWEIESPLRPLDPSAGEVDADLKPINDKIQALDDKVEKLDDHLRSDKLQSVQILAIFVAFFTFVSVQFQLLAGVKDVYAMISLSMVLLGALLLFVCLAHLGTEYYKQPPVSIRKWLTGIFSHGLFYVGIVAIVILVLGLFMISMSNSNLNNRKDLQISACNKLSDQIEVLSKSKSSTGNEFLVLRYQNECRNIWAK